MSSFQDFKNQKLQDPKFKAEYDALAPEFDMIQASLTQSSLHHTNFPSDQQPAPSTHPADIPQKSDPFQRKTG